jgi:hypothetical protein
LAGTLTGIVDPVEAEPYDAAIMALLTARGAVIEALAGAITPSAHWLLCQSIADLTSTLQRVEKARQDDAS